jgi:prevent-host-death family protein
VVDPIVNVRQAKTQFSRLLDRVEAGEELVIARRGKPVARLIPYSTAGQPRRLGIWRGQVTIGPDFDAVDEELARLFET